MKVTINKIRTENIRCGQIVFFDETLWMVNFAGTTLMHHHFYLCLEKDRGYSILKEKIYAHDIPYLNVITVK